MENQTKFKVFKFGRFWQVWNTETQTCMCQLWSKKAADLRAKEMNSGVNIYEETIKCFVK